jgi:hypothetical protein
MWTRIIMALGVLCGCSIGTSGGTARSSEAAARIPRAEQAPTARKAVDTSRKRTLSPPPALDGSKAVDREAMATLRHAAKLYETFIDKAGSAPEYADAVARSRERLEDIRATLEFMEKGRQLRDGAPNAH